MLAYFAWLFIFLGLIVFAYDPPETIYKDLELIGPCGEIMARADMCALVQSVAGEPDQCVARPEHAFCSKVPGYQVHCDVLKGCKIGAPPRTNEYHFGYSPVLFVVGIALLVLSNQM